MAPLRLGPSRRHGARIASAGGAVAVQRIEPRAQIRIVAAEAALADDCGDLGGALRLALRGRIHHHARKPGRQRQLAQMPAFLGDAAEACMASSDTLAEINDKYWAIRWKSSARAQRLGLQAY